MSYMLRSIVLRLLILAGCSNTCLARDVEKPDSESATNVSGDRIAIEKLFAHRVESFNARDLRSQLALFTENTTYHSSTGKLSVMGREDLGLLLLAAWNGPMKDTSLSEEIVRVDFLTATGTSAGEELPHRSAQSAPSLAAPSVAAPSVAVVEFKIEFQGPEDSPISYDELRGVRVLVKREGQWLIHTSCQTPFDKNASLTPERFAEIKESYREEYERQMAKRQQD